MRYLIFFLNLFLCTSLSVFPGGKGEGSLHYEAEYKDIEEINIDNASVCNIEIYGSNSDTVKLDFTSSNSNLEIHHEKKDSKLIISFKVAGIPFHPHSKPQLVLNIPYIMNLDIETSTGSVYIELFKGNIDIKTSTGEVTIDTGEGDIDVETGTGKQVFKSIIGDIYSKSSTGEIKFTTIKGDIKTESTTGNIEIEEQEGSIEIKTATGNQKVVNVFITNDSSFESNTGNIMVDFNNAIEDFTFECNSKTGILKIGMTEAKGHLYFGEGEIKISGKSNTGDQYYY